MPAPSIPGMPPQGARDPVELANEGVCNLEAEKKGLLEELSLLQQRCGVASEVDLFIKLNETGHEQYKPYHAKLNGRLTSVDKQLESANKLLELALEMQVLLHTAGARATSESHAKRARVSTDTDQQHTSPARTESSSASASRAWKVDLVLPRCLVYCGLRKKLYELAAQHAAYDADINYVLVEGLYTLDSDLRFVAYTKTEEQACRLQVGIVDFCASRRGEPFDDDFPLPSCVEHTVRQLAFASHYRAADAPEIYGREAEPSEPDAPCSTVPEERARNEFVVGAEAAASHGYEPESCHLLEKRDYPATAYPTIEGDTANRIILDATLHKLFDKKPCKLTFFCTAPSAELPATEACELTLVAYFVYDMQADAWSKKLKQGTRTGPCEAQFRITHPQPRAFVRYLHLRNALNCQAMQLKHKIQDRDFVEHFNALKSMSVRELKGLAAGLGAEGCSKMNKAALLDVVLHNAIHSDFIPGTAESDTDE